MITRVYFYLLDCMNDKNWRISITVFAVLSISGVILSFLPLFAAESLNHPLSLPPSHSIRSDYVTLVLIACIAACSYPAFEKAMDLLISYKKRAKNENILHLLLLLSLITHNSAFLAVRENKIYVIPCLISSQVITLYLTFCLLILKSGQPIWDRSSSYLSMTFAVIGITMRCYWSFYPVLEFFWLSASSLLVVAILFVYNAIKWYFLLNRKDLYGLREKEIICRIYIITIFIYFIVNITASNTTLESIKNENRQVKLFCLFICSNSALVLLCVALRNQIVKSNFEKLQVH